MNKEQERRNSIIYVIVSSYLETGEPVGSAFVSANCGMVLSSATVRNIMKDLEDEGFLAKPHVSAGRIPTVKCYRYYVQHLMPTILLAEDEYHPIKLLVENVIRENDAQVFMNHIASVLSEVTDLIGVTMSPFFDVEIFEKLEIVHISGARYLLVITLKDGFVKTINLTVDHVIPRIKINETARLLTIRLHGLRISEILRTMGTRLKDISGGDRTLVEVILNNCEQIFTISDENTIHVAGLSRLLSHIDASPSDYSLKLADIFEKKHEIANALKQTVDSFNGVCIAIGGSGVWGSNPPLSLISSVFYSRTTPGVVAVIGPTRIHYPKLLQVIKYTAATASRFFSS
jgi:heat-inducible transcriptional repressor